MLWNLSIETASERMGVDAKKFQEFLDNKGFQKIEICEKIQENENWYHIFDIPFMFECWSEKTAREIYWYLKDFEIKQYVQFSWAK